jgi:hypothetical protein
MNARERQKKTRLEYAMLQWLEERFPKRKVFDDPDVLDNPDTIAYFPTEIEQLSGYDGEDFLDSQYALDGDFLRLEINKDAQTGKRIRITCASANTEWLLNKTSYEDYDLYERLRERLAKEGWKENAQHHWSRELDWFNEMTCEDTEGTFEEIRLNIIEHWGDDDEQPMVKVNAIKSGDLAEHMIMLTRSVAYYRHDFGDGEAWHWFTYLDDETRMSDRLPDEIETEEEVKQYLQEKFPAREIMPFEYKEEPDYSQPRQKENADQ